MPRDDKGLKPGSSIPPFVLKDVNGTMFTSEQFLGQPFLLYFLRGTWWPHCREQLVQLHKNASKYKDCYGGKKAVYFCVTAKESSNKQGDQKTFGLLVFV
jgi:peroxiredoxin